MKTWNVKLPGELKEIPAEVTEAVKTAFRASKKIALWHELRLLHDNVVYTVRFEEHEYINSSRKYWQARVTAEPLFAGKTQLEIPL